MKLLHIADHLALPLNIVTEKLAFLGRTGSGKTYAAMKLAELMLEAGAQIIALDPVGAWHGLRIGGNFSVYIFGGLRGDYPLESTGGKLLADLIVDRGISAVLDISQFIRAEQVRFAGDFAERFFNRRKTHPVACHLFVEEAQEMIPQNVDSGEAKMLHHWERLWKIGRNFGIGGTLVSQRPQELNKKALNQAGTLFVFNMTGPQERRAIADWTRQAGIDEDIEGVLPTLKTGEPHVWSPSVLRISKTVRVLPKVTADVSMTPEVGARAQERPLTPIDVQKLKADMAQTIERAAADDPRELRKRVVELQRYIREFENRKPDTQRVEVSVLTDTDRELLRSVEHTCTVLETWARDVKDLLHAVAEKTRATSPAPPQRSVTPQPPRPTAKPATVNTRINSNLSGPEQRILNALAELEALGIPEPPRIQVALFSGYSHLSSKGFSNSVSRLKVEGRIVAGNGTLMLSDAGRKVAEPIDAPRTEPELHDRLFRLLGNQAVRILAPLLEARGEAVDRDTVMQSAGYTHASSKGFANTLGRLRSLGLIDYPERGKVCASDILFIQ